nr:MAG TPA: hypothetical protein [Caudoviricetes sp.]
MVKYIDNTSRLCVAPMPEADVFAKDIEIITQEQYEAEFGGDEDA